MIVLETFKFCVKNVIKKCIVRSGQNNKHKMNKQLICSGHVKISPLLLEEVIKDSPKCTGRTDSLLCVYARFECNRNCYASESLSCSKYRLLERMRSYEDKFGVVKR